MRALFCTLGLLVTICAVPLGLALSWALVCYIAEYFADFFRLAECVYTFDTTMTVLAVALTIAVVQVATLVGTSQISSVEPSEAISRALPAAKAAAAHLLRNVRTERVGISMRLGTGDAALSALLCGLAGMVAGGLCAVAGVRPDVDIQPDHAHTTFILSARGMFSMRAGHIIGAGIMAAIEFGKGELQRWKTQAGSTR